MHDTYIDPHRKEQTKHLAPQALIRYNLYLNGQFEGATVDPYPHQFTMYLTLGIVNTIEVYAVDEAGNRSAPATMTIDSRLLRWLGEVKPLLCGIGFPPLTLTA